MKNMSGSLGYGQYSTFIRLCVCLDNVLVTLSMTIDIFSNIFFFFFVGIYELLTQLVCLINVFDIITY